MVEASGIVMVVLRVMVVVAAVLVMAVKLCVCVISNPNHYIR